MKCSDHIVEFLAGQGVTSLFELSGGAIAHLLDSAGGRQDIRCVSMHHEQAAAFAAEGYARAGGGIGVALATSGPGALNLLTGIGSCYFDSVPCLFLTGQVNTYEFKFERPVRQIGFQETDIVSIVKPIVKYAELVVNPDNVRYVLEKAVFIAKSGRPGPVLLDIPMNVQRTHIDWDNQARFAGSDEHAALFREVAAPCGDDVVREVAALIAAAKRPILLVGGGVRTGNATSELHSFMRLTGMPAVCSLMGLDALAGADSDCFGLIGAYGNRYGNLALANCDLLLVAGSRLDTRQTGTKPDTFARGAKIIHVDIDTNELNAKITADVAIRCDIKTFLRQMNDMLASVPPMPSFSEWKSILRRYKSRYPDAAKAEPDGPIDPNAFMRLLSSVCRAGDIICLDVGQHQMWASQSFQLKRDQRLFNAGGMGAMGFALPAAIGAAMAVPGSRIVVIAGDGGIQLNIQELDTVKHLRIPVKIVVLNNNNLGMVRQFQDLYFGGRRQSTVEGYHCPDLSGIAEAYGLAAYRIDTWHHALETLKRALADDEPAFIEVQVDSESVVKPKLAVNRPIEDMYPFLDREELRSNMIVDMLESEPADSGDGEA